MSEPRFLLIAYKKDSEDYCRNCLMASYASDHEVHTMLSAERLIQQWAVYLHRNLNLSCNERGYDFWVFKDGIQVWEGGGSRWDAEPYGYETPEYWEHYDELQAMEKADRAEIDEILSRAIALAAEKQRLQKERERQEAEAQRLKDEASAKAARLKQFEKLQTEFRDAKG